MIDLSHIPDNPGCYIFKGDSDRIIYVGKAKNLKKRVKSYFQKRDLDLKTAAMVERIEGVDFIATRNEVEALILENNLIKKNNPRYNIDWKDSKRYAYIQLTEEEFPRLLYARRVLNKGKFYGPFVSAQARDDIINILKKSFRIRTCSRMPKKACLRYHIDLCLAPCIDNVSAKKYAESVSMVELFLKGKTGELVRSIDKDMKQASKNMDYERALDDRKKLEAIEWLKEKQDMQRQKKYDEDIINYIVKERRVYLILFNVYKGILENKQEFEFDFTEGFLEDFLILFYSDNDVPKELILPKEVEEPIQSFLEKEREGKVIITVPQKGEKKRLLDLVLKNVELTYFGDEEKLEDLKKRLKLNETPSVIECFDISHILGTSTVASMVQFRNARPDKSNYRRFRIRTVDGIDDFAAIGEVVKRRYKRLKKEGQSMPDLIIIDGGIGQLNAALKELEKLELKIPIISIAKRLEEIYIPGCKVSIKLGRKTDALKFIQAVRDEAHRFAISYSRLLRKKEVIP